jgi:hypothetical protein
MEKISEGASDTMREDMLSLIERVARLEQKVDDVISNHIYHIRKDIEDIKRRINGRPSWAVSIVLTVLSSLVVGLLVAVIKKGGV